MNNTQRISSLHNYYRANPNAKMRLFCFPYAGGGTATYRSWSKSLSSDIEVFPVEIPGRGYRSDEKPFDQMKPLVNKLASDLHPFLDKPFAFFGHSMGGLISFELTNLLQSKGNLRPVHLFISGCGAPHIDSNEPPIHNLPENEFISELRRLKGTPERVLTNPELMELFLPILRSDFTVAETYVYNKRPRLNCPITVFGGLNDIELTNEELKAWQEMTNSNFSIRMFQGNHFFIDSTRELLLRTLNHILFKIVNETFPIK